MSTRLSNAAYEVLKIDMVLTVIPAVRKAIMDTAYDVAYEDSADHADEFTIDIAATAVMKELAQFLIQGTVEVEDWCPLLHPRQLRKRFARTWWNVKK